MKLKMDEAGHVVVLDGKPVYVADDGKEVAFDAPGTVATISRLNGEAKAHRELKEAAEAKVKAFEGIEDAEAAKKALETVKNIKDGELIAAGKVEEIKAAAARAAEERVAAQSKTHAEELSKLRGEHEKLTAEYHGEKVRAAFVGSKFVSEKTILPGPAAQKVFGEHFKVEEGKLIAYDSAGNKIFSRARPGDVADFDEAIETLVEAYPYKDNLLKGNNNGGGGSRGGGGGGSKTISRAEFAKMDPAAQMQAMTKDGMTVVD
jgi:hypothetical protein